MFNTIVFWPIQSFPGKISWGVGLDVNHNSFTQSNNDLRIINHTPQRRFAPNGFPEYLYMAMRSFLGRRSANHAPHP
jgi:hypothetical protein